jgi:hypothetical protein
MVSNRYVVCVEREALLQIDISFNLLKPSGNFTYRQV